MLNFFGPQLGADGAVDVNGETLHVDARAHSARFRAALHYEIGTWRFHRQLPRQPSLASSCAPCAGGHGVGV